ncbi:CAP domain-containing protein [Domibacillus sp. PGB-M46]|uniref:CAP domain-containing protein n=1 Tax=Domibacillus sp. PGB-M46 TaxID=2910255 RepID=UPI001F562F85|nr:CAP domain-containing protein [Domibacillus sp. PGB-M46]MCI2254825.1 CAP domain-containing protein [Domibacillus sp. PGB-M46]
MKVLKMLMSLLLTLCIGLTGVTVGSAQTTDYLEWPEKTSIDPNHDWTIKWNQELDANTVNNNNIYVQHDLDKVEGVKVSLNADKKSIKVEAPEEGYSPEESYYLFVEKSVKSLKGKELMQPIKMKFTTKHVISSLHSKEEIIQKWNEYKPTFEGNPYIETPSISSPYSPGSLKPAFLEDGLNMANFVRYLTGLPDNLVLDEALNEQAQYGAVLTAANGYLSHFPEKPEDMPEGFYNIGYQATSTSNLHYAFTSSNLHFNSKQTDFIESGTLAYSVKSYMDDHGTSNLQSVGHRRWILSPQLKNIGFGYATKPSSQYSGYTQAFTPMKVFDKSGPPATSTYTTWPSAGYFPVQFFDDPATPWSIHLNYNEFLDPIIDYNGEVTVELVRKNDGKKWTFNDLDKGEKFFNVDTSGYGDSFGVIFKPDNITSYNEGEVFSIKVSGLRDINNLPVTINYEVELFDILH